VCSTGIPTDYYIYGGTPPYRVTATFPGAVTLVNSTVNANGGFFEAITNGSCVDPLTFSIVDATGRQTTATLSNVEGSGVAPTPDPLAISPSTPPAQTCAASSFSFVVSGGTPPYSVTASGGAAVIQSSGFYVVGPITGTGVTTVLAKDQSSPQKVVTATITCS
jgi:hypothetical protein